MAKSGRPQWKPSVADRRFIEAMAAGGIDQDRIAQALGVAPKTLRRHCRDVLDSGADRATSKVIAAMLHMATKAPYAVRYQAARFWLSCRAEWRERPSVSFDMLIPIDRMTDEQFDAVMRINGMPTVRDVPHSPTADETNVVPYRPRP
jgi:hypothetical protein